MIRLKLIGLTLVAMFAVMAGFAASASALQWLLDGKPIERPVHVKSSGQLQLADLAATGGATEIICKVTDEGTVGPLAHDEEAVFRPTGCSFVSGKNGSCEASREVTGAFINLPWLTLLLTEGPPPGELWRDWFNRAGKAIGWDVECTVLGVFKAQDECTTPRFHTPVVNLADGVGATFLQTETLSCTLGNASSGMIFGTDLVENPTGHTISISNSPNS
jgi:hypothetical protein